MNAKFESVKQHLIENKRVYIAAGVGLVVGIVIGGVTVYLLKRSPISVSNINMTRLWSPGDNNIMKVYINPLGDPGNVVQCVETGTIYASQGQAARELGVNASRISEHLSGKLPHIKGNHLVVIGKAGQVLAENT